ncbi:cellulose biosynthesis protein BcsP [Burkholderia vietnamiensis]|uniref:cellulose biosynthesis protein BcsP n=1 Tax=Burkholderia vietnamiensis TaxID=60552 RepID=UPI0033900328
MTTGQLMSSSRDIESLFKRFGGDAGRYHEVRAEADADAARARWPLLAGVELQADDAPRTPAPIAAEHTQPEVDAVTADTRVASATDAAARDRSAGALKKLVGKSSASDRTRAPGSSEPLQTLFERLRGHAPADAPKQPPVWTGRS